VTLARQLKLLYENRCQICGESITLPNGTRYSEAHHVRPLGRPHHGPDVAGNILVLCPNHHVMLDYGVIALERRRGFAGP
jgi:predicted restriction endonuclease